MDEEILNARVEKWVFEAVDLEQFYERNDPKQREEHKRQLKDQSVPIENYKTPYKFFYG